MSVLLVFNALETSEYLEHPLAGESSGFGFLLARFENGRRQGILDWDHALLVCPQQKQSWFSARLAERGFQAEILVPESLDARGIMSALAARAKEDDTVIFLRADAVCANLRLAALLLSDHREYRAEFTFAEGYPSGFGVSVADASILPILSGMAEKFPVSPGEGELFFSLMKKDVNNFEIETRLSKKDHRLLRIDLHTRNLRDFMVCQSFAPLADLEPEAFEEALASRQEGLRTLPAFLNVQILKSCPQVCSRCPHGITHGKTLLEPGPHMALDDFMELCRRFEAFAPDSTVGISLWGEPSLHPYIYDMLREFSRFTRLDLVVETSGLGWNLAELKKIAAGNPGWIRWIVGLDTLVPENYARIRGQGFEEALEFAQVLPGLFPGKVWVQAVRSTDNEKDLPGFVKYWKDRQIPFIIQKYDHFSASLPDLRVSDISPLERLPCWHLKRDLVVLLDGTVARCREDLAGIDGAGNALRDSLPDIWNRLEPLYRRDLEGKRDRLCEACDESYTFNF